jgi:hypothetical protein
VCRSYGSRSYGLSRGEGAPACDATAVCQYRQSASLYVVSCCHTLSLPPTCVAAANPNLILLHMKSSDGLCFTSGHHRPGFDSSGDSSRQLRNACPHMQHLNYVSVNTPSALHHVHDADRVDVTLQHAQVWDCCVHHSRACVDWHLARTSLHKLQATCTRASWMPVTLRGTVVDKAITSIPQASS